MKFVIECIKGGKVIGYWDDEARLIRTKTICLIDEHDTERQFENATLFLHVYYDPGIFPVLTTVKIDMHDIFIFQSRRKYDKIIQEHWPSK